MEKHRSLILTFCTGLGITLFSLILMIGHFPLLDRLEERWLDVQFLIRGPKAPPDHVIIAAIDDKSLGRFGRWPWDRRVLARLVETLHKQGAAVIVFDMLFVEQTASDPELQRAISKSGNVVLAMAGAFNNEREISPPKGSLFVPPSADEMITPTSTLASAAVATGHINVFPEADGVVRREALFIEHQGERYPSLGLRATEMFTGHRFSSQATSLALGSLSIPVDPWGRTLIYYYGATGTFPHLPIADIIDGETEPLTGCIVIIGATAPGLFDLRVTPFSPALPGVEKHASIIASFLQGHVIDQVPSWMNIIVLLASGMLLTLFIQRLSPSLSLAAGIMLLLLLFGISHHLFLKGLVIATIYPAVNMLMVSAVVTAVSYARSERHARRIRAMFANYVTDAIVNELIINPDMARLGGERRVVTLLFSDLKDFTPLCERHQPELIISLLNTYLEAMTDIILSEGGTLDKFIGDAIVVFWNAPQPREDHADRALSCAMRMQDKLTTLQAQWRMEGKPLLETGIGITTGEVVVGNIGAEGKKMDYTAIGDQVNLCARVEGLTRTYDAGIIITEATRASLRDPASCGGRAMIIESLGEATVKGREAPVQIHRVTPLPSEVIEE
jgi:adenylate cyclase